jgi:hypothetical protein
VASLGALLVALAAFGVAWRALDQAHDARDIALAGRGQAVPGNQQATGPAAASGGSGATAAPPANPNASGEPPPLDQRTVYKVKYDKQTLILKTQSSYSMYVDLDEPRANVAEEGHDLALVSSYNGGVPHFTLGEGVEGSEQGAPGMTPQDCAEKIRIAPINSKAQIPARQGSVLCLTTSFAAAQARGDVRHMVLMEITAVAADAAVTVQLTGWNIPR